MLDVAIPHTPGRGTYAHPGATRRASARPGRGSVRLQVVSDLHLDSGPNVLPRTVPGVDAVVVAGDTAAGVRKSFAFLRAAYPAPTPLVVVLGNREFHGQHLARERRLAGSLADIHGIALLDDTVAHVAGVRFVGATLWTDYLLGGPKLQPGAMFAARSGMEDHARISSMPEPWIRFRPYDALAQHHASPRFLDGELAIDHDGPTVVVTHHAPSARSLGGACGALDGCFASRLDDLVASSGAALWLHGHVHARCDYMLGRTRVLSNPRGRRSPCVDFDPSFVVEVSLGGDWWLAPTVPDGRQA